MTLSARARGALLATLLAAGAAAWPAWAQEDQATARALFDQGKALMARGKHAEACPKLEAAAKLYSSAGILLNLADCYEKTGRTASAWTRFGEASSEASRAGREEQAREAKRRQDALTARLTKVAVQVAKPVPGLVVRRNGVELAAAAWGLPMPVDPGEQSFEASAPGFIPWSKRLDVNAPGQTVTVDVPALEPEATTAPPASTTPPAAPPPEAAPPTPSGTSAPPAAQPAAPPPTDAPPAEGGSMGTLGLVLAGVGVVGMGVSGFLGLQAKSEFDDAKAATGPDRQTLSRGAVDQANLATIVFALGAVATATGVVLWTTADPAPVPGQEALRAPSLTLATGGSSLFLHGRF